MKNAKRKGTRNEHRSMKLLEASGYSVTRAAASLGTWDIIGVSATDVVLVQCKTRDWPGTAEMETLRDFPAPPNARKLVHRWRDRQRVPDVRAVVDRGAGDARRQWTAADGLVCERHRQMRPGRYPVAPGSRARAPRRCQPGTRQLLYPRRRRFLNLSR
jgi:hypothetical protein